MVAGLVFQQMIVMFVLMCFGFVMYRKGMLDDNGSDQISGILLNVCTPLIIINAMNVEYSHEAFSLMVRTALVSIVLFGLAIIISRLIYRNSKPIEQFSSIFSNAGFIGIPLVGAILGQDHIFILTVFILISNIVAWTYGVNLLDQGNKNTAALLKSGVVIASFVGVVLFLSPFTIPFVLAAPIKMVADLNTVLAMFVLGIYIAKTDFKLLLSNSDVYLTTLVRLVVLPLVCVLLFSLLPSSYLKIKNVLLIAYAAPIGVIAALFSKKYQLNHTYAAGLVSFSTLFSIFSIPFILWFANLIW